MLCFGVILFLVNAERIKYKILIYAVLLYSFLAILANGSRTGFIMYLLVIFIYLLSELKRGSKSIYYIFPVFLWLAVYYFNHVLSEGSYERFMHISDDIKSSDLANRQWIWRMALEIMSEKMYPSCGGLAGLLFLMSFSLIPPCFMIRTIFT